MSFRSIQNQAYSKLKSMSSLSLIFWIILILVLFVTLAFAFPEAIGAKEALIVSSGSMEPVIPTGAVIWVYDAKPEQIVEGDVITFSPEAGDTDKDYTTHRVVEVRNNSGQVSFITKGDANEDPDPSPVGASQLFARHGITVPYMGYAIVEARRTNFFLVMMAAAATILILKESLKVYIEYTGMKENERQDEILHTYIVAFSIGIVLLSSLRLTSVPSTVSQRLGLGLSPDLIIVLVAVVYMIASIALLRIL